MVQTMAIMTTTVTELSPLLSHPSPVIPERNGRIKTKVSGLLLLVVGMVVTFGWFKPTVFSGFTAHEAGSITQSSVFFHQHLQHDNPSKGEKKADHQHKDEHKRKEDTDHGKRDTPAKEHSQVRKGKHDEKVKPGDHGHHDDTSKTDKTSDHHNTNDHNTKKGQHDAHGKENDTKGGDKKAKPSDHIHDKHEQHDEDNHGQDANAENKKDKHNNNDNTKDTGVNRTKKHHSTTVPKSKTPGTTNTPSNNTDTRKQPETKKKPMNRIDNHEDKDTDQNIRIHMPSNAVF